MSKTNMQEGSAGSIYGGAASKSIEKLNKTVGLRLNESGPSVESRGPDSITVEHHHNHQIKVKEIKG
jgi:hypothetical protein